MVVSELLFRMGKVLDYDVNIDRVGYISIGSIPTEVLGRDIYTWDIIGKLIIITTEDANVEKALRDDMVVKFPKYSEEQIILMIKSGVNITDIINQLKEDE